jgi:hypothetical protein
MPTKAKPKSKKAVKPARKKAGRAKKGPALECSVCGYRVVVDEVCGCETEHVLMCCNQPMKKV